MATRTIQISSSSSEVIFEGNLLKAPPLNRRGRKKWHERYFIIRANRTLECHKSLKAAESHKHPRRIIDLRECINLEIGLEYKKLKHIMSLGTFKRTFFYAAHSDPLMLQWADVLEKAKNARDGESIEVLNIGLRRSKEHSPSPSARASYTHTKTTPTKKTMALAHTSSHSSTETIDLRKDSSRRSEGASASEESYQEGGDRQSNKALSPTPSQRRSIPKHNSTASKTPSPSHVTQFITIPNKVPPPVGVLSQATRNKDGFFTGPPKKKNAQRKKSRSSSPEKSIRKDPKKELSPPSSGVTEGKHVNLSESQEDQKQKSTDDLSSPDSSSGGSAFSSPSHPQVSHLKKPASSAAFLHSNMTRSFRYKKITMRREKPLFPQQENISDAESEDEDEDDRCSSVPGPIQNGSYKTQSDLTRVVSEVEISIKDITTPGPNLESSPVEKKGIDIYSDSCLASDNETTSTVERHRNLLHNNSSSNSQSMMTSGNNLYSKITVAGPKRNSSSRSSGKRPILMLRSNSQSAVFPEAVSPLDDSTSLLSSYSLDDSSILLPPPPMFVEGDSHPSGDIDSVNSLDCVLVEPPDMFSLKHENTATLPENFKRKLSRTKKVQSPNDLSKNSDASLPEKNARNEDPDDGVTSSSKGPDRDSTESSDTGYTSSTSPGYQEHSKEPKIIEEFVDNASSAESGTSTPKANSNFKKANSIRSVSSVSSISSDTSRYYIPLVFHSPRVNGSTQTDTNLFTIQVCLVENSEELIKDLVTLKSLETFSLMECEEIHGEENVAAAPVDDFTVQTSLEDLEFGFSIVKSTQKDLFMRKVRQFTFEIKNLFGTSKPFSCDVEVRHADQLTVLPIEVM